MISSLLVANRGEIARRVFRTCRMLGIGTVAVHSDADVDMPFVRDADVAVRLPGNTAPETYLRGDLIIEAALATGADAIHPGYGFLSENADFARAVQDAGLTWVGPDPSSIETMGSKISAKKLMEAAGVPVLGEFTPETATVGDLPLLVKASAGGGGRGMRVVRDLDSLAEEISIARSEAASAFGDGTVFVEPYVENGRHIEVQVLGAPDGVLVLGERDCSVQRRHQKVIEEAPAPGLSDATRQALHDAARHAGEAIDYRGAGTVEFLYDPAQERFYFLEMNTRLQVEHPVTEAVFGVDLVAMQLAVAEGRPVAEMATGEGEPPWKPNGHAVEARLYAEDPAVGYQPQSGRLRRFDIPNVLATFENPSIPGIRLDSGVGAGDEIGTFYDAMIAKVISWAPSRDQAIRQLAGALGHAELHGLSTNRDLLVSLLSDPVVLAAKMNTTWLDGLDTTVIGLRPAQSDSVTLSAFAATVALTEQNRLGARVQQRIPAGFRNVVADPLVSYFETANGEQVAVRWRGGHSFTLEDRDDVAVLGAEVPTSGGGASDSAVARGKEPVVVSIGVGLIRHTFKVHISGEHLDVESALGHVALRSVPRFVDPADQISEGSLLAPMPGSVISVNVAAGDQVAEGQVLLVMEAMKMQHTIVAPYAGVVTEIRADVGQQVDAGAVLAVVQATKDRPLMNGESL